MQFILPTVVLLSLLTIISSYHQIIPRTKAKCQRISPTTLYQSSFKLNELVGGLLKSLNINKEEGNNGNGIANASKYNSGKRSESLNCEVLVVGGGITGMTAAYYIDKNQQNVIVAESKDQVGGNLISKKNSEGFLWEEGPNSFQPNSFILRLAKDVDMIDELVLADSGLPRFVFWRDSLYKIPGSIKDAVLDFALLSWPGKIRAGLGALGLISEAKGEETVQQWVTRHLGSEAFEKLVDPFVSGVYAGDPKKLSMKAALKKVFRLEELGFNRGILSGAIVRIQQLAKEKKEMMRLNSDLPTIPGGSLGSFANGLQSLPLKIAQILGEKKVLLSHKLVGVRKISDAKNGYKYRAEFIVEKNDGKSKRVTIDCKTVLLTLPAYAAAEVLGSANSDLLVKNNESSDCEALANSLRDIAYPAVASVTLAYPNDCFKVPLQGFGHLIPRKMRRRTLGTIWSSALFPGRAPEGYSLLLSYIGGAQDDGIKDLTTEEIVAAVHQDIAAALLKPECRETVTPKTIAVRLWQRAIPQYNLGHLELLARVESLLQENEASVEHGFYLGGNYRSGVAFGDCVQYGYEVAQQINKQLSE